MPDGVPMDRGCPIFRLHGIGQWALMSRPGPRVGLALLLAGRYSWRSTGASAPLKRRWRWVAQQAAKGAAWGKGWDGEVWDLGSPFCCVGA